MTSSDSEGAVEIAAALKINSNLTTLDLGVNKIGDVGATAIAEALKVNTAITHLSLEDNDNIKDMAAISASIAASIAENKDPTRRAAKVIAVQEAAKASREAETTAPAVQVEGRLCGRRELGDQRSIPEDCTELDLSNLQGTVPRHRLAMILREIFLVGTALNTHSKLTKLVVQHNELEYHDARAVEMPP